MRQLAGEIGSRPTGSAALRQAAEYIREQFVAMGYQVELSPYTFSQSREQSATLTIEQPLQVEVRSRALVNSGSGTVHGQLVFAGLGRQSDFQAGTLEGHVALVQRGSITFEEKVANAAERGASAVIIYNNQPGVFSGAISPQHGIPVVGISDSDGQVLRDYLAAGSAVVQLSVEASTGTATGHNVIASGTVLPDLKTVIVGAHYDSVDTGPGANDNASGVASILEIARVAADRDYPFNLIFMAFGDEEIGLIGSRRYVEQQSPEERAQMLAMINIDMVGVGDSMEFGGSEDLTALAMQVAGRLGYDPSPLSIPAGMSSDHAPFLAAGVPAVFFHRTDDANYHTAEDSARKVQPEHLEAAGRVGLELLEELRGRG